MKEKRLYTEKKEMVGYIGIYEVNPYMEPACGKTQLKVREALKGIMHSSRHSPFSEIIYNKIATMICVEHEYFNVEKQS